MGIARRNVYRTRPPQARPVALTGDVASARRVSHAVVTTTQLYRAVAGIETSTLTTDDFWQAVADANGLADLPDLTAPHEPDTPVDLGQRRSSRC